MATPTWFALALLTTLFCCTTRLHCSFVVQHKDLSDMSIDEFLEDVNFPAVHTYKEGIDLILCVRFEDQITVRKSRHKITMPTERKIWESTQHFTKEAVPPPEPSLTFKASEFNLRGDSCPFGSIPVRETVREHVQRAGSPHAFARKRSPSKVPVVRNGTLVTSERAWSPPAWSGLDNGRMQKTQHTETETSKMVVFGAAYGGTMANLNTWQPFVRIDRQEESSAQVWVAAESGDVDGINTVEAGWRVYPRTEKTDFSLFPRFFTYWTRDNYFKTGCYNMLCPGFVSLAFNNTVLDKDLSISYMGQRQADYSVAVRRGFMDALEIWWLYVDRQRVGYWTHESFTTLNSGDGAAMVAWGGEVTWSPTGKRQPHTETQMGSGKLPDAGYGYSAHIRNIEIYNLDMQPQDFSVEMETFSTHPDCYDVKAFRLDPDGEMASFGNYMFFGGPGYNTTSKCVTRNGLPFF